ncbi:MAG: hypothetical protein ACRD5B_18910, partial [Nitrososphaeraceae archaeon]
MALMKLLKQSRESDSNNRFVGPFEYLFRRSTHLPLSFLLRIQSASNQSRNNRNVRKRTMANGFYKDERKRGERE